jgi:hypothetical protein
VLAAGVAGASCTPDMAGLIASLKAADRAWNARD